MQAHEKPQPRLAEADENVPEKRAYKDADRALEFLQRNEESEVGTVVAVDEKALVRKIDWMIVPIMFACYFLQYLDKSLRKSLTSSRRIWRC
jgi:hypothetical protein